MDSLITIALLSLLFYCVAAAPGFYPDVAYCPRNLARDKYLRTFRNRCYEFVLYREEYWEEAHDHCRSNGGSLATVRDADTQIFLADSLRDLGFDRVGVWIGLNDRKVEEVYEWDSGEKTTFSNWSPGEPSLLHSLEDCVTMDKIHGYQWDDRPCGLILDTFEYICEYGMGPIQTTPPWIIVTGTPYPIPTKPHLIAPSAMVKTKPTTYQLPTNPRTVTLRQTTEVTTVPDLTTRTETTTLKVTNPVTTPDLTTQTETSTVNVTDPPTTTTTTTTTTGLTTLTEGSSLKVTDPITTPELTTLTETSTVKVTDPVTTTPVLTTQTVTTTVTTAEPATPTTTVQELTTTPGETTLIMVETSAMIVSTTTMKAASTTQVPLTTKPPAATVPAISTSASQTTP